MTVIARRKEGLWLMDLFIMLVGSVVALIKFRDIHIFFGYIFGGVLLFIGVYGLIEHLSTPRVLVALEGNYKLHFPRGVVLDAKDVTDVSYRRASSRGAQYKWGTVTVSTNIGEIKLKYVAECEEVAKTITELMYKREMELEEFPVD